MKKTVIYPLILILAIIIQACNQTNSTKDTTEVSTPKKPEVPEPRKFTFEGESRFQLKEQLFFYLREELVNIDGNTFVQYEDLVINENQFEYQAVIADMRLLNPLVSVNQLKPKVILTSYRQSIPNENVGDSVSIKGSLEILDVSNIGLESQPTNIKVRLTAQFTNSFLASSPYSYDGYERQESNDYLEQELIVILNEPRIYGRENLYLKARIKELSEEDLASLSKEELPYFRNEIFARHGHVFKTDKMKTYFGNQPWYTPYFDDATELLNGFEQKNALFIKSLES